MTDAARLATDDLAVVTRPAPVLSVEGLLAASDDDAVLWHPPGGPLWLGLGVAARFRASGPDRFERITEAARAVLAEAPELRAFAGFAFAPGASDDDVWRGFAEAEAVLPRINYVLHQGRATLSTVGGELPLPTPRLRPASLAPPNVQRRDHSDAEYIAAVRAIGDGIASGAFDKVVVARRVDLELSPSVDPPRVLQRLASIAPACTRFAFRRSGRWFLGATPERLVEKRGREIRTEALAGSAPRGADAALLASAKDRAEHRHVVDEIRARLEALGARVEVASEPELRALSHVVHLRTPIVAQLSADRHVLEVLAQLHPTPAVGGVPRAAALEWLAKNEPFARGWYASPVGWFDAAGDGELAVALRSAVLDGPRAHLFAGAGIVQGSTPEGELAETRLKLEALARALGVEA
ncbi:MAG: isochorismate synthase [Polyangiaceae bacterium]|nr:isochorismate synthase [Polyangiaceae bacterium]